MSIEQLPSHMIARKQDIETLSLNSEDKDALLERRFSPKRESELSGFFDRAEPSSTVRYVRTRAFAIGKVLTI